MNEKETSILAIFTIVFSMLNIIGAFILDLVPELKMFQLILGGVLLVLGIILQIGNKNYWNIKSILIIFLIFYGALSLLGIYSLLFVRIEPFLNALIRLALYIVPFVLTVKSLEKAI